MWLEGRWRWAVSPDEGRTGRSSSGAPSSEWRFLAINRIIIKKKTHCEIVPTNQMMIISLKLYFFCGEIFLQWYQRWDEADTAGLIWPNQREAHKSLHYILIGSRFDSQENFCLILFITNSITVTDTNPGVCHWWRSPVEACIMQRREVIAVIGIWLLEK